MGQVRIRRGSLRDVDAIMRVHRRSIMELGRAAYTEKECASWSAGLRPRQYQHAMDEGGETFIIAERADKIICFCSYNGTGIIGL